jgi:hypothetical protein
MNSIPKHLMSGPGGEVYEIVHLEDLTDDEATQAVASMKATLDAVHRDAPEADITGRWVFVRYDDGSAGMASESFVEDSVPLNEVTS